MVLVLLAFLQGPVHLRFLRDDGGSQHVPLLQQVTEGGAPRASGSGLPAGWHGVPHGALAIHVAGDTPDGGALRLVLKVLGVQSPA